MGKCVQCGNEYSHSFEIVRDGSSNVFDSFECAIQKMAPQCANCGCRIIGHGIEAGGIFYCCANCARKAGVTEARDNV